MKNLIITILISGLASYLNAAPSLYNLTPNNGKRGENINISFNLDYIDSPLQKVALVYCNTTDTIHFSNVVITSDGNGLYGYSVTANFNIPINAVEGNWNIAWKEQNSINWQCWWFDGFQVKALAETPEICVVGVDSTGKNRIVWEKPNNNAIKQFNIYREDANGTFVKIGSKDSSSFSTFTDLFSNSSVNANSYKISILDTTNNETDLSNYHKTIHLTVSQGQNNSWNLIWNKYEGLTYSTINILRGTDPTNLVLLTSISNNYTSFTDINPPASNVYYQIEIINPNNCNPTGQKSANYNSSRSNFAYTSSTGLPSRNNQEKINVWPNPTKDFIKISNINSANLIAYQIKINNTLGQEVFQSKIAQQEFQVNLSEITGSGIYFVHIIDEQGNIKDVKKIVLQ